MIIPSEVDLTFERRPWGNYLVIAAMVVAFIAQMISYDDIAHRHGNILRNAPVLEDLSGPGLLGYMWVHGGLVQLAGSIIFARVLGNAVCSKVGSLTYVIIYLVVGVIAGLGHVVFSSEEVLGATGAVYGLMGMYLVLFPKNGVNWWLGGFKTASFTTGWLFLVMYWIVFSLIGAWLAMGHIPVANYICGFLAGMAMAAVLLAVKAVKMDADECSLLQVLGIHEYKEAVYDKQGRRVKGDEKGKEQKPAEQVLAGQVARPKIIKGENETRLELDIGKREHDGQKEILVHESSRPRLEREEPPAVKVDEQQRRVSSMSEAKQEQVIVCGCGGRFKANAKAGREIKCPKCGKAAVKELRLKLED